MARVARYDGLRKKRTFRDITTGFFPTSEEGGQTFQTDDVHYPDLGSVMLRGKFATANQKHYPDLGSEASSVWKFCTRFSVRHLTKKTVVTSRNVDSLLRLAL